MRKVNFYCKSFILTAFCFSLAWGQGNSYLAQKLMVENDFRQRITNALSKIIDDSKYVIDVKVEIEISDGTEEQITLMGDGQQSLSGQSLENISSEINRSLELSSRGSTALSSGLPIPGFEFESDAGRYPLSANEAASEDPSQRSPSLSSRQSNVLSRTVTSKHPSTAKITKLDISIILQEGAAPELIENIRQVVKVSSGFNRARGDALSIMTATFKDRRDEKTAEQILLKNIAEKLESLEEQRSREGSVNWKEELDDYKAQEAERREQDKMYFQQQLTSLEAAARDRAYQSEKREILRRDSLKLRALNQEIDELKSMVTSSEVSGDEADLAQNAMGEKISEKETLDAQIAEKLAMLDAVQSDLDRSMGGGSSTMMIVFVSLLGALVVVLAVVLIIMIMGNKQKQQQLPPPWMYPPRPRKKKSKGEQPVKAPAQSAPVASAPLPVEDTAVLQSEVSDMKQAVVSMSVGQPNTATRIVKEWMEDDTPPPEPEPEAPAQAEEEEDGGKKKKKKKKK